MPAKTRAPKPPDTFVTAPDHPELAQAVSLALAVLRTTKASTWNELAQAQADGDPGVEKALSRIAFAPEQAAMIDRQVKWIGLLRSAAPKSGEKTVTLAVCPKCELPILVTSTKPSKCTITAGCGGKYIKVAPAPKTGSKGAEKLLSGIGAEDEADDEDEEGDEQEAEAFED